MKLKLRHALMAGAAVVAFSGQAHADGHAVWASSSKAKVSISGQIARAVAFVDDGDSQRVRHSEQGQTESGIDIKGSSPVNKDITASFHIDMDVDTQQQNSDGTVSGGFGGEASGDINTPKVWAALAHKRLGKVAIGRNSAASDGVAHNSLHGAYGFAAGLMTANLSDIGLRNTSDGTQSGVVVDGRISCCNGDPGGRSPMVRYDTPRIAGFAGAISHEDAGHVGFGANYGGSVGDMKVSLKAAWHHGDKDANDGMALSAALMHSSGLTGGFNYSYTMDGVQALTNAQTTPDPDQHHWYAHVGYKAKFNELGNTYIGGEWQQDRDFTVSGAEGNSIGVGFSQDIDSAAVSFYAKYLHLNVEEPNQSYEDIQAVDTGIRMKF
jgi:hypothetical protein